MRQRSTKIERIKRVNRAVRLLGELRSSRKAIRRLREEYGISRPQAYRYVKEAERAGKALRVPEAKEVMRVKLPKSMSSHVRRLGRTRKGSISGIVAESLKDYLKRHGA